MVISIFKFLSRYYGISLNAGEKCSHLDAKQNFEFLETCSSRYAQSHSEMVNNGKIVYVRDTNGVVKTYICPKEVICSLEECEYSETAVISDDADILDKLSDMPTYIVRELLGRYKDNYTFYRVIKKELVRRGVYENKIHKIDVEIDKLEESDYNDKYKRRRKIKRKKS